METIRTRQLEQENERLRDVLRQIASRFDGYEGLTLEGITRDQARAAVQARPDDGKNYHVYIAISEPERDRLVSLLRGSTSKANY